MVKVAVLVSGGGTNLQAILDAKQKGELQHADIALVLSSKEGAFALERGAKAGIKSVVVERKNYKTRQDYDNALLQVLNENKIEVVVLAGFLCILGETFINTYKNKIINVHPSLIPSFCGEGFYGLAVHEAALEKGVKVTGATVHLVNEIPDGGKILLQKTVDVLSGDTAEILQKRVMENAEWELLPKALEMLCKGEI